MREMVFRERQEKVAHVEVFAKIIGQVFSVDHQRVFGAALAEYTAEVFQETYDARLLEQKVTSLRRRQRQIAAKRKHDESMITRLDKMGQYYDQELGPKLDTKKKAQPRVKK